MSSLSSSFSFNTSSSKKNPQRVNKTRQCITDANTQSRRWNLLAAICSMALQQWGTKSFKASAGWHWKENDHLTRFRDDYKLWISASWAQDTDLGCSSAHVGHHPPGHVSLKYVCSGKVEDLLHSHLWKHQHTVTGPGRWRYYILKTT